MQTLDLTGLHCPQVVLRLAAVVRDLAPGTALTVVSTDPLSAIDIPYFLDRHGHRLIARHRDGNTLLFEIACAVPPAN